MTTDQSRPVSRAFMSRLREVLTARLPQDPGWVVWVDGVVEELADVTPPQGIDRDALEAIADLHLATGAGWKDEGRAGFIEHVRAILAKVGRPTIDRGALLELLSDETGWEWDGEQDEPAPIFGCDTRVPSSRQSLEAFADRILALVRPVEGRPQPRGSRPGSAYHVDRARVRACRDGRAHSGNRSSRIPSRGVLMARGPYMPDPPTRVRLDLDEQGARILHGIVTDVLPSFFGPAAGRVRQIVDALEEQL